VLCLLLLLLLLLLLDILFCRTSRGVAVVVHLFSVATHLVFVLPWWLTMPPTLCILCFFSLQMGKELADAEDQERVLRYQINEITVRAGC
jgi:CHASE2 domain-containing sensor protein